MQWVYVVESHQHYESSVLLRIFSNYDKAFAYLEELVKGKNGEWADRWDDDNFRVIPEHPRHDGLEGGSPVRWMYTSTEDDDRYYTIEAEPLY